MFVHSRVWQKLFILVMSRNQQMNLDLIHFCRKWTSGKYLHLEPNVDPFVLPRPRDVSHVINYFKDMTVRSHAWKSSSRFNTSFIFSLNPRCQNQFMRCSIGHISGFEQKFVLECEKLFSQCWYKSFPVSSASIGIWKCTFHEKFAFYIWISGFYWSDPPELHCPKDLTYNLILLKAFEDNHEF